MSLWPFSKDNSSAPHKSETEPLEAHPAHDAVNGGMGPFDGDSVDIDEFEFGDFAQGILNLGSLQVPLPIGSEVQVEMGPNGPTMLHVLTEYGRCTPVAFAAPRSGGHWDEARAEITADMSKQGLSVSEEMGPWGPEIVGAAPQQGGTIRVIGVDGPRWMLRMTLAAPLDKADDMAALGREIAARTFVYRGNDPILPGTSLPVALPQPLAEQVAQEMQRRSQQNNGRGFPNNSVSLN
ncbi:DUF3710 domain-containing protein [Corynebacterium sp. ES2794-CONJ1]|uniref:DUF3710 domain-containing protein n=1 Tax=unclassified Corynebacterium TaxID=2624378 RepID=UPI002168D6FB|nr:MULTISPECIES: DUF3710 domain-containing protein [unclassified Corynebacterium]MCS4489201.1 DUF3710 domain-containing protein [Corynebacterium sp. ES2775-CONJ]MCS4491014.1 DUF3710 domain-containing protein [Corynebacterium sp. ES2715-CONJ3]MCS4531105.1 DUF3710 domain-containing protein [Corynebacterium sp. ES2730-CONJ]MCU9518472.1 DUF3710 domain-containing protein [Corynebacterium sp. ES2794-CONJ1]